MSRVIKSKVIRHLLFVCSASNIVLTIYTVFFIYPLFAKLSVKHAEEEAERVAIHLASLLIRKNDELKQTSIPYNISIKINQLKRAFDFMKIKIYSEDGKILFSTDSRDIGDFHGGRVFQKIVTKGHVFAKFKPKNATSDEGEILNTDVVETYVPIMSNSKFNGAFEIYYHAMDRKKSLDHVMSRSSIKLIIGAFGVLVVVFLVSLKADKTISERDKVDVEREATIAEDQERIDKSKHIPTFIPICASCNKIRDDKGDWKQVIEYFREYSEINFSHGLCPSCKNRLYPQIS